METFTICSPPQNAVGKILESYNGFDELKTYRGSGENLDSNKELRTGHLSLAVEMLRKTFLQNKEVSANFNFATGRDYVKVTCQILEKNLYI